MRFAAPVQAATNGGHVVAVPAEIAASFPTKRAPVLAWVNGTQYRSRLAVYGGVTYLGLRKDLLAAIDAAVGDTVEITLEEDSRPRVVDQPAELTAALRDNAEAAAAYAKLAFTHRREFAGWVAEGKKAETRTARAARAVEMLLEGRRR
jgi:hypothetical protein